MTDSPNSSKNKHATPTEDAVHIKVEKSDTDYLPPPNTNTRPIWMWLLPLVLVTLGLGFVAGKFWVEKQADAEQNLVANSSDTQKELSAQKPVLTVETVKPSKAVIESQLSADGTISPETTASVSGKVNGVAIEQVLVREGNWVKKGQVLAVFDTDAMQQQVLQAQASLAEAQTNFAKAKSDYERIAPLLEIKAVSQQEVDSYKAAADQAYAARTSAQARLTNQQINLENAKVVAPVSGIISEKNANVGSVPGPEPLFSIIESGKLEWQAQVDPNKLGNINIGTPVKVSLPNNKSVMGKVSRISPTTEKGSRQVIIYASLENHPNARAGMYQRGTFDLGSDNKVTIPVSAVVTQDGYDYVMQVKAIKNEQRETIYRIQQVKVKLGERDGDRVVLLEPLKGNGNIVRQGGSFLSDGDIVRIANPTTAP